MSPIHIPHDWGDRDLITFEEFCDLVRIPQRTVRDWRRRGVGPRWARFNGCGRLYITVAEARRFLLSATAAGSGPTEGARRRSTPVARHRELPDYVSLEEAAQMMSLSTRTIRRRISDGTIPAYQCGRRAIRIRVDELEAALRRIPSAR